MRKCIERSFSKLSANLENATATSLDALTTAYCMLGLFGDRAIVAQLCNMEDTGDGLLISNSVPLGMKDCNSPSDNIIIISIIIIYLSSFITHSAAVILFFIHYL